MEGRLDKRTSPFYSPLACGRANIHHKTKNIELSKLRFPVALFWTGKNHTMLTCQKSQELITAFHMYLKPPQNINTCSFMPSVFLRVVAKKTLNGLSHAQIFVAFRATTHTEKNAPCERV